MLDPCDGQAYQFITSRWATFAACSWIGGWACAELLAEVGLRALARLVTTVTTDGASLHLYTVQHWLTLCNLERHQDTAVV